MTGISDNFYIIGHRGAAGEYFENSLQGIEHALALDIAGIEIDIRERASELWVFHDLDLERLTGVPDNFTDADDVTALSLKNGEPIPRLSQVLELCAGRMMLNIEIKAIDNPVLLLDQLAAYPAETTARGLPSLVISSFNHRVLLQLRQMGCNWPLAPISAGIPLQSDLEVEQIQPWSWHFDDEYIDFELVRALRQRGIPSLVFTVNSAQRMAFLKQRGIAGIFTDYPSKMVGID